MAILQFLSPEIILAIGGLVATIVAYIAGGKRQKDKQRADQAVADVDAMVKRRELENEVESLSPDDRRKRLDQWVREAK